MAVDKLVDSTQLNADLTSVANAIRTKGGTSGQLAFPAGFVSAVNAIPTGVTPTGTKQISITQNGIVTEDVTDYANAEITVDVHSGSEPTAMDYIKATATHFSDPTITTLRINAFKDYPTPFTVDFPNLTELPVYAFASSKIQTQMWPKVTKINYYAFNGANALQKAVFPVVTSGTGGSGFVGCSALAVVDGSFTVIEGNCFRACTNLVTLILRNSSLVPLGGSDSLINTPFYHGKAGGDIYIPKALYDHLGDGTASDYKAATNWSTYDSYGTITWHPIEGSIYETQYADGTPIT